MLWIKPPSIQSASRKKLVIPLKLQQLSLKKSETWERQSKMEFLLQKFHQWLILLFHQFQLKISFLLSLLSPSQQQPIYLTKVMQPLMKLLIPLRKLPVPLEEMRPRQLRKFSTPQVEEMQPPRCLRKFWRMLPVPLEEMMPPLML